MRLAAVGLLLFGLAGIASAEAADTPRSAWKIGDPIVTYWAGPGFPAGGPPLTDSAAQRLADGGWNLVWCQEGTLQVVRRHGLRGLLTDPLLTPSSLDDPAKRAALEYCTKTYSCKEHCGENDTCDIRRCEQHTTE